MPDKATVDLGRSRRVHVVGAGGAGMSAIATVLAAMGHRVTGSDTAASPVMARLAAQGVDVRVGHHPDLAAAADVVVRSTAVPDSDSEVAAARAGGTRVWRRAEVLAAICARKRTVAVSGTHGKTTTSAMLAVTLIELGRHPSLIVGGDIAGIGPGARWDPAGDLLVVEADESDGTFVELGAEAVVVTSVEPDHLEFYGGLAGLEAAFGRFVADAPGPAVVCADDPGAARLAGLRPNPPVLTYGLTEGSDLQVSHVELSRAGSRFQVSSGDRRGTVALAVPGLHNVRNAAAVIAVTTALGTSWEETLAAVGRFAGVGRRFEARGEAAGVSFVDGYDHLPTEVAAAIATARSGGWGRVVVVFQPHRFSRTEALWADFGPALAGADEVVVTGIYPAGESPRPGVTGELVAGAVRRARPDLAVHYVPDLDAAVEVVAPLLHPGDLCLTLGAGDVTTLPDRIQARLREDREGDGMSGPGGRRDGPGESRAGGPGRPAAPVATAVATALEVLGPLGDRVVAGGPIGPLTTYRVGGAAAVRVTVAEPSELELVARAVAAADLDVLVVGRGSNLLVADAGFPGLAVLLDGPAFAAVAVDGHTVRAGAAVALPTLARQTVEAGLTGMEWAVGVPGSVGGGVRMNAGGHGSDMAATLTAATVFDLRTGAEERRPVTALDYSYRHSSVLAHHVVLEGEFALAPGDPASGRETIREIVRWRREHQPGGQNAGSVFTNPPGDSAGRIIDAAGLKGRRLGTAMVSTKHANFIQADAGGSADDVHALIGEVRAEVAARFGVDLRPEVRTIGFGTNPQVEVES